MLSTRRTSLILTILAFVLLMGCVQTTAPLAPSAPFTPTIESPTAVMAPVTPTPTPRRSTQTQTNDPLAVLNTQPEDKVADLQVDKDKARIVVQFNHPVVPLAAIDLQKDLPQPLALNPALPGEGQWINTSTLVFVPSEDLQVGTHYVATIGPIQDLMGETLQNYRWSFETTAPAVLKTSPVDRSTRISIREHIALTFNTEMDVLSTVARFSLTSQPDGQSVPGHFQFEGHELRFFPDQPLSRNTRYLVTLTQGALDSRQLATVDRDTLSVFTTAGSPNPRTIPQDGDQKARAHYNSFRIEWNAPMDEDTIQVSVVPTITNQRLYGGPFATMVTGGWKPSQPYTVTISGNARTIDGESLGQDLVIHFANAPWDASVSLNVPDNVGMYDINGPQTVFVSDRNTERIDYRLFQVSRSAWLDFNTKRSRDYWYTFQPPETDLLRELSEPSHGTLNTPRLLPAKLPLNGPPLAPGIYMLLVRSPQATRIERHVAVLTGLNLMLKHTDTEALVWVTDLKTGQPVANQPVALYSGSNETPIASGRSDEDGIWRTQFTLKRIKYPYGNSSYTEPLTVLSEVDGKIVGVTGSGWDDYIKAWDFELPYRYDSPQYYANLYTDRAIYRPGQTAYFRGILRRDDDAQYRLPDDVNTVPIRVVDARGKDILAQDLPLSRFGTFNGEVALSESAPIGDYSVSFKLPSDEDEFSSAVHFQVAAYRRPEFQVSLQSDKNDYVDGDRIKLQADASYYFGGGVGNADVRWMVQSGDLYFYPPNMTGWWDFSDYDYWMDQPYQRGLVTEGKGKTDARGQFSFDLAADLSEFPSSQNLTIETEITDINNQAISSRVTVPVHKGRFYIGLRPQKYVGAEGEEQAVDILTVDTRGVTTTQQAMTLFFFRRDWFSTRAKDSDGFYYWRSTFTDTLVSKVDVKTDDKGLAVARFLPKDGGTYKVLAEGKDVDGRAITSSTFLWVYGRKFINWRMENNDRVELIADKKEYLPGDVAEILVPLPFKDAEALLTIERGTIREVRRLSLKSNSELVEIPIKDDYVPNIFVSIAFTKGRAADSPVPQFKLGYVMLPVRAVEKELRVTLTPDRSAPYRPGEQASFALQATNSDGMPVEAEFSLALVDKAIQSLAGDNSQSLRNSFYSQRALDIHTAASLIKSVDRISQELQAGTKGGGGGDGPSIGKPDAIRKDFRDTAYWNASVVTDASGRAQVSLALPDNLTTWNMSAKGVTRATQVGEATTEITSTQDLLIRPMIPRFSVVGDKVQVQAVVNNNTPNDLQVDIRLDAQGLVVAGDPKQKIHLPAHDKAKVSWATTVDAVEQANVVFTANGAATSTEPSLSWHDAVETGFPVVRPTSLETVGTAGQVGTRTLERIELPPVVDPGKGELELELSPSLAAASRRSLKFLESFDYDCSEQTVSKFFPNVATYMALKEFGVENEDLKRGLESNVSREIQRLYSLQHMDGGWGWWWIDKSRPNLTAYALLALHTSQAAGFAVEESVLERAKLFLERSLEADVAMTGDRLNERAFVLYVLTEVGSTQTGRVAKLFDDRANLSRYAQAYLLMALQRLNLPQSKTLQAELTSVAIQSATGAHWEEAEEDYWAMNTDRRSTAIILMALARSAPDHPLLPNVVRWLMVARKEGHWETTQETAWAVLALTKFMQSTGELKGSYKYQVELNGKAIGEGVFNKSNIDQPKTLQVDIKDLIQSAASDLVISRDSADGRLYYSAYLSYAPVVEKISALNRGVVIQRQYEAVDQQTLQPTGQVIQSVQAGEYVRVVLTLVTPNDLFYVALEDPLPAGLEAVDTRLKTTTIGASSPRLREKNERGEEKDPWYWHAYWDYWTQSEIRDDRVAAFATFLSRGTYEYVYLARATVPGQFQVLPARAWQMYFPDVFGRTAGTTFSIDAR